MLTVDSGNTIYIAKTLYVNSTVGPDSTAHYKLLRKLKMESLSNLVAPQLNNNYTSKANIL